MSAREKSKIANVWKVILSAVPLLTLIWGVVRYVDSRKPPLRLESRFLLLESDDLVDLFTPEKQGALLADVPLPRPLLIQDQLYVVAAKAFSRDTLEKLGRTIKSATFLAITNAGSEQADTLEFRSIPPVSPYRHLGKSETALLCIQLTYLDGTSKGLRVDQVTLSTGNGRKARASIAAQPTKEEYATVAGHTGISLGYVPTKTEP